MRAEERILRRLIDEYDAFVEHFASTVTSTVFAKRVASNTPFVITGYGKGRACAAWTAEILSKKVIGAFPVALTPDGRADSVVEGRFVEPQVEDMTMTTLLERLHDTEAAPAYLQWQDDCLHLPVFEALLADVGPPPDFAQDFFADRPVANLWIGNDRSVTAVHSDPYENLYLCVRGKKTFTLFPPVEYACFHVAPFPRAKWQLSAGKWQIIDQGGQTPWSPINVLKPDLGAFPRFGWATPIRVELNEGDLLYLPALWLHHVQQTNFTVAVNWWFELNFCSPLWHLHRLVRQLTMSLDGQADCELDCDQEPDQERQKT